MKLFDAHLHIIDKAFPLKPNQGYLPDSFTCGDYEKTVEGLPIKGGAIVSGSFQGFDQTYLKNALTNLGDGFVGVTQLPFTTPDHEIVDLNERGVRALRFNVNRGGSEDISRLDYFSRRVYDLVGWHTELYVHSKQLPDLKGTIQKLPAVSIDHLGLAAEGFSTLLGLVDQEVKVKATGFGRVDFDPLEAMRRLYDVNPDALMFGTDLPSTRAHRPFRKSDVDIILNGFDQEQAEKILYKNALYFYIK